MEVAKKIGSVLMSFTMLVLCLSLFGCSTKTTNNEENHTDKQVTLETVSQSDAIRFDNTHVEICVYSDENYYFSNRNEDFCVKLTNFLKNTKFSSQRVEETDAKSSYYIFINDGENLASFSIYDTDIISKVDATESCYYYCDGIYKDFENTFGTFLEQNSQYCRSATTRIRMMNEYAIYDKNNNVIESDCITRNPYLFYDSEIVHLWVQTGTGTLTRYAKFYDVENGSISPEYYGQTDYFGDLVCATGSSQVVVYKMFSGEQKYCFDSFEKPLADCIENICSAYFSKDGTQIIVEYLNTEFETEQQVFDLPQNNDI